MKRLFSSTSLGDGKVRVKVTLQADSMEPGSTNQRKQRYELLTLLGSQPDLSYCQGEAFEVMRMYWDGTIWILEFEATVPEKPSPKKILDNSR